MAPAKGKEAVTESFKPATWAIHADDPLNSGTDVAPAMHVSTTFRYPGDPDALQPVEEEMVSVPWFQLAIQSTSRFYCSCLNSKMHLARMVKNGTLIPDSSRARGLQSTRA